MRACILLISLMIAALPGAAQSAPVMGAAECVGGEPSAPIRIDVFSDYQCPACQTFYLNTMRQMLATYARDNKVCVVYHEMPLAQHQYSRPAARFAIAARRVGREQWIRVTDALFVKQPNWSASGKVEEVVAAALSKEDFAKVKQYAGEPSVTASINRDLALAREKQVRQTPTFVISANGRELTKQSGAVQYGILKRYIDSILQQQ